MDLKERERFGCLIGMVIALIPIAIVILTLKGF